MKTNTARLAAFLVLFAAGAWAPTPAQRTIEGWPQANKQAAEAMIEKYGQPDSTIGDRLEWYHRGQFKRIAVDGRAAPNVAVENTVAYQAPNGSGLLDLEAVVTPNNDMAELTSCGRNESANVLALNLADGVMHGRMSADQAREQNAKTLKLEKSGKSSPAAQKVQFQTRVDPLFDWVHTAPY